MKPSRSRTTLLRVGRRLRQAREALGLTQRELFEDLGVQEGRWSHWETGRRLPDPLVMARLAERHAVSLDWIYRGVLTGLPARLRRRLGAQ
ncbi:MAG: helix-turn-helix transcriptional regulator [Alphaproteobacteria bacterium]|nr:helix-turn-helix transcriptional regulator [Alphaproteobacteria bacterium]